ncbi:MAG: TatD family hydrolase [Pirellulales bacterium]
MATLIDTHAHLDQEEFAADRDEVIERARAARVQAIVAVGTTAESSAAAVALAEAHEMVWAAVGIQPNYCSQAQPGDWERIVELARRPRVVAIGETGLDNHWDYAPAEVQRDFFDRQLRLAAELDLPVVIHMRESGVDILTMLEKATRRAPLRGVMHSFTVDGQWTAAGRTPDAMIEQCVEMGFFISFAGMVTYKKSADLIAAAARVPDDRILVETDSPYLAPHPVRGKRNEPANVVHTAQRLAEARGQTLDEFAALTTANATRLFRFIER